TGATPRNTVQRIVTGPARFLGRAPEPDVNFASSETQVVMESGTPTFAVRSAFTAMGPCVDGPFSSKLRIGGVLPTAASVRGDTSQSVLRVAGMDVICPLTLSVHVNFFWPKSAGTLMVKTPQSRPVMKCVGWPRSGPPGSI